jgi:hypothetical protein
MKKTILIILSILVLNAKLIRTTDPRYLSVDKSQTGEILYDTQTGLYWQDDIQSASTQNYWGWLWTSDPANDTKEEVDADGNTTTVAKTWWDYIYATVPTCPQIDGANKECVCKWPKGYWRVPTYNELNSIIDRTRAGGEPAIKKEFKNVSQERYWTSTTYAGDDSKAWFIDFSNGDDDILGKGTHLHVRCVH